MTDNDIIKALECCANCENCSYETTNCILAKEMECRSLLAQNALDLITRQQAELENLKVENQSLRSAANSLKMHYEEAQAEIDSLRADLKRACAEIDDAKICKYSFIASSSILDFAERLRRNAVGLKLANRDYRFVSVKEIDSLVIKMSGETHEW